MVLLTGVVLSGLNGIVTIMETQNPMIKSTVHSCSASYTKNEVKRFISHCKQKLPKISKSLFQPYIVKL